MAEGSGLPIFIDNLALEATVGQVVSTTQFVAPGLAGFPNSQFVGYYVWVLSKANGTATVPKTESPKSISGFIGVGGTGVAGTVTHSAFSASLAPGDRVLLMNPAVAAAWNSFPLPVPPTTPGTVTQYGSVISNWQAAEQDLLTIGAAVAGQATSINFLGVGIQNLIGNISIRMYATINGVERRFYPIPQWTTFNVVADAPCIPAINGSMIIPGRLRVTVQSDNVADNGAAVTYEAG